MNINYVRKDEEQLEIGDIIVTKTNEGDKAYLLIGINQAEDNFGFLDLDEMLIIGKFNTVDGIGVGDYLFGDEYVDHLVKSDKISMSIPL